MDLEQCYKELEGDYAEVMRRLRKEELVHRFLIKFLESDEVQTSAHAAHASHI